MTAKDFSEAMGELDLKYVEEAQDYKPAKHRHLRWLLPTAGIAAAGIALALVFTNTEFSYRLPTEGMTVQQITADRVVYSTLSELEAACDLIVIGEYAKNSEQQLTSESGVFISNAVSENEIYVSEVLYGEGAAKGSRVPISQRYGVLYEQNTLYSFSGLTPMNRGDRWIFFLSYDEQNETYWCTGDCDGRYPLPTGEMGELYEAASEVTKACDNWVKAKGKPFSGELSEGEYMTMMQNGEMYIVPKEQGARFLEYQKQLYTLRDGVDTALFGVYDTENINLPLYCAMVEKYSINK